MAAATPRVFLHQLRVTGETAAELHCTTFDGAPLRPAETAALEDGVRELTGRRCRVEHRAHIAIGKSGKHAWLAEDLRPTGRGEP
ncbi:hypothetical protein AF335_07575 [Streptomyces eurocidicus]|uniref:Uncharacterized protein n=1 Tax=Streptomyces eurocidicus TaxID=66423 RepID=A0A2N8P095_STREU|nr:hypothetical protein [Streptomyces eurocidicus]MBB5121751.1 hypothetical protein [Streptomyces eurocidicus]MBF6052967.1 hypothetical protein [Streptomyces eurocidicus]PNE34444.1 hypothetical protein AF335_07575 [Streptomyces eurocidicus]